jgi:hypothetical protein
LGSSSEVESSQTSHAVEPYDIANFYRMQLEQKDKEIKQLEKQLENLKKLVLYYKQNCELQATVLPILNMQQRK